MTIHSEHPFLPPEEERDPLRRFRGRMPSPVSVWTAERAGQRAGWTVSSLLVADGAPAVVIGLVDEDSALADLIADGGTIVVNLLGGAQRGLADAFAGVAPAPGGPFRLGTWTDSAWGPVLSGAPGWLGGRLIEQTGRAGWSLLLRAEIEHVDLAAESGDALAYLRGRYRILQDG